MNVYITYQEGTQIAQMTKKVEYHQMRWFKLWEDVRSGYKHPMVLESSSILDNFQIYIENMMRDKWLRTNKNYCIQYLEVEWCMKYVNL